MNLLASTSTFGFFTLISRILGYIRDILIAIFLGTSIFADAFFVAFRLPNTFRRLFAEGTFNAALKVPSANNLLRVFGILNAIKNASANKLVPRKIAIKTSLKYPVILLTKVKKLNVLVDLIKFINHISLKFASIVYFITLNEKN